MSVRQRMLLRRLEDRARLSGDDAAVRANFIAGATLRVPPATPQGITAVGTINGVVFEWQPVTRTASGKPLEALARYLVYYKLSTASSIPTIDPDVPSTYTGTIIVDNTAVLINAGREYEGGTWKSQNVAVRIVAIDRAGRQSPLSAQVQGSPASTKTPVVIDAAYINSYDPNVPNQWKYHTVWDYPSYVVESGYQLIVTVWPYEGLFFETGDVFADIYDHVTQYYYGLFEANGVSPTTILNPGTYTNLKLKIYHYSEGVGYVTCYSGQLSQLPEYTFDYNAPGNLNLSGYITEKTSATPATFNAGYFEKVLWMVWKVPL